MGTLLTPTTQLAYGPNQIHKTSFPPGPGRNRLKTPGLLGKMTVRTLPRTGRYPYTLFRPVIGQGFLSSGRDFGGHQLPREFPRLAIYTKDWAEGPAIGVHRESLEFTRKRISTKVLAICPVTGRRGVYGYLSAPEGRSPLAANPFCSFAGAASDVGRPFEQDACDGVGIHDGGSPAAACQ